MTKDEIHDNKEDLHSSLERSESIDDDHASVTSTHTTLFKVLVVNKGITYFNLISYLLACMLTICLVSFLSIVQPFIITVVIGQLNYTGSVTGKLILYDEILTLPCIILWGIISDRIGRRPVYSFGFSCLGISLILFGNVKNIYPHMLLCRLLFAVGASACTCMMTATLGDVVGGRRAGGRVSALVGIFAGFGGLLSGVGLLNVPSILGIKYHSAIKGVRYSLYAVGGSAIALAIIFAFTLPNPSGRHGGVKALFKKIDKKELPNLFQMAKYGIIASRDPRIALSYLSSFVARADTVLFTSYISLWVAQYFYRKGWCQDASSELCLSMAVGETHKLTGMAQGIALAFAPFFGFLCEKFNKSFVLGFAGLVGAVGTLPFAFTKTAPSDKSNMAFVLLIGAGQIGVIVVGMVLVNGPFVDPRMRGSIAGVFSFLGSVSIMVMGPLGGFLFDEWMPGAPFVLLGAVHIIILLLGTYVAIITPRLERQDRERAAAEAHRLEEQERTGEEVELH